MVWSAPVDDIRWFASNPYTALIVPALRRLGLRIATEGDRPARLALAMSGHTAESAWRFGRRVKARLLLYLWDLPPVGLGTGRPDPVWWVAGRFLRIPRPWGRFHRGGYFSRLHYIARHAEAVWVPSRMTLDSVRERFAVEALEVPYCYDSGRFVPRDTSVIPKAGNRPPILLTVSRLRRHKNQAAVLHAAGSMDIAVRVLLIGRGPQRANLERLAEQTGVSCTIDSEADDQAVTRAYHEAAVAVCPSRFEGFGLTPVEAVASGVPVVASDIPPHREFVGRAARLAPLDDPAALVKLITEALNAPPADPALVSDLTIDAAAARFIASLQHLLA
jgi:glycosyltransferase involved in cell wall biosynthesis